MNFVTIQYEAVGVVHSPFKERQRIPRQAVGAPEVKASIEILPKFRQGLADLDGFSHLVVVYHMHLLQEFNLTAHPPWDDKPHGVFSTCSPFRPNPIGLSVVKLDGISGNILHISGVDMADETPVLDIKPYVPKLYPQKGIRIGWLTGKVQDMNTSCTGQR